MTDTPATRNVHRAQLLGMATSAQQGLDLDDPADYWYRQGQRDAYAYAAALLVTERAGDATRAAAARVPDLLGEGVVDLGVLLHATEPGTYPGTRDGLSWMGSIAFARATAAQPGTDHDLGHRWGHRRDIRVSHRRQHGGGTGLLYAYDRTWDEYAVLGRDVPTGTAEQVRDDALAADLHPDLDDVVRLLRQRSPDPPFLAAHSFEPCRAEL